MSSINSSVNGPYRTGLVPKPEVRGLLHASPSVLWAYLLFAALSAGAIALLASEPRWYAPSFALDLFGTLPLVGATLAVHCLRLFQRTRVRVEFNSGGVRLFRHGLLAWPIRIGEVESYQRILIGSHDVILLTRRGRDTLVLELPSSARAEVVPPSLTPIGSITGELRFHVRAHRGDSLGLRAFPFVLVLFLHMFVRPYGSMFSWGSIVSGALYFFGLPLFGLTWLSAYAAGIGTIESKPLVLGPNSVSSLEAATIRYADIQQVREGPNDLVIVYQPSQSGFKEEVVRFGAHTPGPLRARAIAHVLRAAADQAKRPSS